mmetsp:Transcript_30695/g.64382  ORF Transcript_30695/g.64382 Transcript_30695/m.64382 type:complete len:203 (-) Transcript_30695:213-821(-)
MARFWDSDNARDGSLEEAEDDDDVSRWRNRRANRWDMVASHQIHFFCFCEEINEMSYRWMFCWKPLPSPPPVSSSPGDRDDERPSCRSRYVAWFRVQLVFRNRRRALAFISMICGENMASSSLLLLLRWRWPRPRALPSVGSLVAPLLLPGRTSRGRLVSRVDGWSIIEGISSVGSILTLWISPFSSRQSASCGTFAMRLSR